jgi:DNA repair protein RecN (Recombination protein N)
LLLELKASNLGIIKEIHWHLHDGLNVITGETGAGKSLVIDAVELLLTGKAGDEVIRFGQDRARVEGIFTLPDRSDDPLLAELLAEKGLADGEDTLVIACELRRNNPDVMRVNGRAVPKGVLRQIGRRLIDIHGQSEHLSLLDVKNHLDFLDACAGTLDLRREFSDRAAGLAETEEELRTLTAAEQGRDSRRELLEFQINEIDGAALRETEEAELEAEKTILTSAEALQSLSREVYQTVYEGNDSGYTAAALDRLQAALQAMQKLAELDPSRKPSMEYLDEAICGLTEMARDIRAYGDGIEYDAGRLEEIEGRQELIRSLKRKYGNTIGEIIAYRAKAQSELDIAGNTAERRARLESDRTRLRKEMGELAMQLSAARQAAVAPLIAAVTAELGELNLGQVKFDVSIIQIPDKGGIPFPDGTGYAFSSTGADNVEFLASTNPGEPLKPLARIASTGELSRFTLALKGVLSESYRIPVVIFDEIDIGIGGRSGDIIGQKLWMLARNRQVVCVTHLPQIAVFADAHFSVYKETLNAQTTSRLENLEPKGQLRELAAMLAGPQYTATAMDNAGELLRKAGAWKQARRRPD